VAVPAARGRVVAALVEVGGRLEQQRAFERAAELYRRALAVDEVCEAFCRRDALPPAPRARGGRSCARTTASDACCTGGWACGPSPETERVRAGITDSRSAVRGL
jgi:hypothetical protein